MPSLTVKSRDIATQNQTGATIPRVKQESLKKMNDTNTSYARTMMKRYL